MKTMIDIHPAKYIASISLNEKTHKLRTEYIMDGKSPKVLEQDFLKENDIEGFNNVEEMKEKLNEVLEGNPEKYTIFWETKKKAMVLIFD